MMNGKSALKFLAVVSAVALGGGYVWMNQRDAAAKRAEKEEAERVMLPGSKSRVIPGVPDESQTVSDVILPQLEEERTVLPGSKSAAFVIPAEEPEPPEERTVLPGSKSIDRILELPSREKEGP